MPVLPIVRLGHPVLRLPARPVESGRITAAETQRLVDDMIATMRAAEGVGLAAPQVGVDWQLFVCEAEGEFPLRVLFNPVLDPLPGDLVEDWEGCLSIPDLRGLVPRHPSVRVQGLDRRARPVEYVAEGFEARVLQHENDHLHGVVYLDRMRDLRSLGYLAEWHEHLVAADEAHGGERPE